MAYGANADPYGAIRPYGPSGAVYQGQTPVNFKPAVPPSFMLSISLTFGDMSPTSITSEQHTAEQPIGDPLEKASTNETPGQAFLEREPKLIARGFSAQNSEEVAAPFRAESATAIEAAADVNLITKLKSHVGNLNTTNTQLRRKLVSAIATKTEVMEASRFANGEKAEVTGSAHEFHLLEDKRAGVAKDNVAQPIAVESMQQATGASSSLGSGAYSTNGSQIGIGKTTMPVGSAMGIAAVVTNSVVSGGDELSITINLGTAEPIVTNGADVLDLQSTVNIHQSPTRHNTISIIAAMKNTGGTTDRLPITITQIETVFMREAAMKRTKIVDDILIEKIEARLHLCASLNMDLREDLVPAEERTGVVHDVEVYE
ncbi:hypothetical protein LTR08_002438 [Meristemomyces frigidus]|nr:hypothetical protein LTR08_002438 [Meristemomyces frigidus]